MLDIRYIRENADSVEKTADKKGYKWSAEKFRELDKQWLDLLKQREDFSRQRNQLIKETKNLPGSEQIERGRGLREREKEILAQLDDVEEPYKDYIKAAPNIIPGDTPLGGEENNQEIKKWGETPDRDFQVKDHLAWGEERGLIDFERGAKVAGHKFYYLKDKLVDLELALLRYGLDFAKSKGFYQLSVPHLVNDRILEGAGFSARGKEKQVYKVEDEDLNLIATAEIPLTGFFADEIIPTDWLPSKMVAWSPSYRVEGGAYGKYNRGLFRTHQFNKVEMYIYCKPPDSENIHQELLAAEEEFCQSLGIPYRLVRIAAGDLGAPAYKKFDIEYYTPVDKTYRELMSCSNVTDYQARRLNIRYKNDDGKTEFVHTLNATLAATSRLMIAIIENFQDKDGNVAVPKALQDYMHGQGQL